jgi:transcriptional regulator with XRE-family HTH domain
MLLSDKLMQLRRSRGMSQEDLANEIGVSRQSVSKWEGAQAVPDLDKLVKIADFFGVSTDYLLKEEQGEHVETQPKEPLPPEEKISFEQAKSALDSVKANAPWWAFAVCLCILSPITLFVLLAFAELGSVPESVAVGVGVCVLIAIVAVAVGIFVWAGLKDGQQEQIKKGELRLAPQAEEYVSQQQAQTRRTFSACFVIGVCLCVLSPIPLLVAAFMENAFLTMLMLGVLLMVVAVGVALLVYAGVQKECMDKLRCSGKTTEGKKRADKIKETVSSIYWLIATAVYFVWSFSFDAWGASWVVWPIAAVLFGVISTVMGIWLGNDEEE